MAVADFETRIAELEVAQRRAEQIARVNAALSSATNEQGILSAVATLAEQHGVMGSALAFSEMDADGVVTGAKVVAMQMQGQPVNPQDVLPTTDYPLDDNPILRLALENPDEPLFVENMFTDPRTADGITREVFRHTGMTATIIMWLQSAGRVQGVMTFNWADEQPFNEEIRTVFKAIQPVAAAVVANRRSLLELERTVAERTAALRDSEKRLIEAQRVGGIGIWELDVQTFDLYWSDTMFTVAGRDPARGAPVGGSYMDIVHPDDRDYVNQTMLEAAESGQPFRVEYRVITDDGAVRYVATTGYAATDEATRRMRFIGTMQDVSARKQADIERERLAAIANSSLDCIGIADLEGRLLYMNPAGLEMVGYFHQEEIIGTSYTEFTDPESARLLREVGIPTAMERGYWRGESRLQHRDGRSFPVEQALFPIRDAQGNINALATIITDISERKQAEAERDRLQQQVIEAQRQALAELSTPIIPIMDRIIVMPIVGSIDTGRARDIMRSLLSGISQYRAQIAILDITGVPIVDSGVADHLNRTIQAARLKGAQTIITGVSDAVAETVVDLGIDWTGFETLRDLQTGLIIALDRIGIRLTQRPNNGEKRA
ncbi:MAG: PAS domain S-box protein [Chloroflexi bacterium]|nr:PAS domain S-box protein [Chloroflexota bacterium]